MGAEDIFKLSHHVARILLNLVCPQNATVNNVIYTLFIILNMLNNIIKKHSRTPAHSVLEPIMTDYWNTNYLIGCIL